MRSYALLASWLIGMVYIWYANGILKDKVSDFDRVALLGLAICGIWFLFSKAAELLMVQFQREIDRATSKDDDKSEG